MSGSIPPAPVKVWMLEVDGTDLDRPTGILLNAQLGRSGYCLQGRHSACAHGRGGPLQSGVNLPVLGYWYCSCDCHPDQIYTAPDAWTRP